MVKMGKAIRRRPASLLLASQGEAERSVSEAAALPQRIAMGHREENRNTAFAYDCAGASAALSLSRKIRAPHGTSMVISGLPRSLKVAMLKGEVVTAITSKVPF
jgi:hypothetical protein